MLYQCASAYATTPYYLDELGMHIYSIEELCYYLKENAAGLEDGIMRLELCSFIDRELKLPELASQLTSIIRMRGTLASFVVLILNTVGFCSKDEVKNIETLLNENAELGIGRRKKARGDYYLNMGRLMQARAEYEKSLENLSVREEADTVAAVTHNLGVAYARMFHFDKAADLFRRAWDISGNIESYEQYLAALRLGTSRENYVKMVLDLELDQEKVTKLEGEIERLAAESRDNEDYKRLQAVLEKKKRGGASACRSEADELLNLWKREFRRSMEMD